MLRLLNWGTTEDFDNKNTLQQGTIWHRTDTKKHKIFWNSEIYLYMISLTFNNVSPLLYPKHLFLLTIITFQKTHKCIF